MQQNPYEPGSDFYRYEEPETRPIRPASFARRLLAWLPLAFFAACLVTALLAQPLSRAFTPTMPVTGGALPAAPTLTPAAGRQAAPSQAGTPQLPPGTSYQDEAASRISACTMAFHEFFILQRMAAGRYEMIDSEAWRIEAVEAMRVFEEGCAPLGSLPDAPAAFQEADRWLKLAAGEVDSASARFSLLMDGSDSDLIRMIGRHMDNFLEFTHNAEQIFDQLKERREF